MEIQRNRWIYFGIIVVVVGLGLLSRTSYCPDFLYLYLGDALYALMWFFVIGFLLPKTTSWRVLLFTLVFCYLIEAFQLYQSAWVSELRTTLFGRLVLGSGFLWSDILSYTVGGLIGVGLERVVFKSGK